MEIVQENNNVKISCRIRSMPAGLHKFHWHENYELCQAMDKPCSFLIDGVRVNAEKGDIIAIDSHTVHRFIVHSPETHIRILQFPVKLLLSAAYPIHPLRLHIPYGEIAAIPTLADSLENLFRILETEDVLRAGTDDPYVESISAALYFLLMRHFAAERANGSGERMEFYRITEYISANLRGELTAISLSKALFISRGRLTSIFHKYAGVTLGEYVSSLRIQHARSLLEKGCSVTEAAFESGFQSIRTFNSTYKRLTGETPSQYIKS